jgi:hypothetical protein
VTTPATGRHSVVPGIAASRGSFSVSAVTAGMWDSSWFRRGSRIERGTYSLTDD